MAIITCPSGMQGEIRGLTIKDGRYLTNERLMRDGDLFDWVLKNCWLHTTDAGPYAFKNGGVDWDDVLDGDGLYALISIRNETYPPDEEGGLYELKGLKCPNRMCRKPVPWDLHLGKFLEERTKRITPEVAEIFRAGNRFTIPIPTTDKKLHFRLPTRRTTKTLRKLREQQRQEKRKLERANDIANNPYLFNAQIDGIDTKVAGARQDFLETLGMRAFNELRLIFEEMTPGIETAVPLECQACDAEWEIDLPLEKEFYLPSRRITKTPLETTDASILPTG